MVLLGVYFELALRGQAQLTCTAQGDQLQLVHPIKTPSVRLGCDRTQTGFVGLTIQLRERFALHLQLHL